MKNVAIDVSVNDVCDAAACRIVSVMSKEPVDGLGDGDTAPDWDVTSDLALKLRAERAGGGTGRVCTVTVECSDVYGNASTTSVFVTVPHD